MEEEREGQKCACGVDFHFKPGPEREPPGAFDGLHCTLVAKMKNTCFNQTSLKCKATFCYFGSCMQFQECFLLDVEREKKTYIWSESMASYIGW